MRTGRGRQVGHDHVTVGDWHTLADPDRLRCRGLDVLGPPRALALTNSHGKRGEDEQASDQ